MTKTNLVKKIAEKAGINQKQAAAALDAALEGITAAVVAGDKIQLTGFGTFECKTRAARTGINPLTKQPMSIPASKVPSFKAGKNFKDLVKG